MKVALMTNYDKAKELKISIGGFGGFFGKGMRWADYIGRLHKESIVYAECIRAYVIENNIKKGGDWHQSDEHGVPIFDDGTSGVFSYRAWGDIMAAIWSEKECRDYSYMDFYMTQLYECVAVV